MAKRTPTTRADRRAGAGAAVALAFAALAFAVYAPALHAPFFSDDLHYVQANAYVQTPSLANARAIWSPVGPVVGIVENYAPVHLSLHALAWQAFGADVVGHHALNVAMHVVASLLLVQWLRRSGVATRAAVALGAVFLVHPANVEAVAWISQVKTTSALALALAALLAHRARPVLALACFALALLAKPTAAVALPVAALALVLERARGARPASEDGARGLAALARDPAARWLVAWGAVFAAFAAAELAAYFATAGSAAHGPSDALVRVRSAFASVASYARMVATGTGLAVFHDPDPATSALDPRWLGGLAVVALAGWRVAASARARSNELLGWTFAAVSFAPVCGAIALPHAIADRYAYFLLPGVLLVAGVLATRSGLAARRASAWVAAAVVVAFASLAFARARLWSEPELLVAASEARYPRGEVALLRGARRAALAGDAGAAVDGVRAAMARGYDRLDALLADPAYRALRGDARFDALVAELARGQIERARARGARAQSDLRVIGQAQWILGERDAALASLRAALERPGPYADAIRAEVAALEREARIEAARARRGGSDGDDEGDRGSGSDAAPDDRAPR